MKIKHLKIETPCHESWDKMTPVEHGRHCDSCQKDVIDLTHMTPIQVQTILMQNAGQSMCARMKENQRDIPIFEMDQTITFRMPHGNVAAGLMLAGSLLGATVAEGQINPANTTHVEPERNVEVERIEANIHLPDQKAEDGHRLLKGAICSKNSGKGIQNVVVDLITLTQRIKVRTDSYGRFSFEVPMDLVRNEMLVMVTFMKYEIDFRDSIREAGIETINFRIHRDQLDQWVVLEVEDVDSQKFYRLGYVRPRVTEKKKQPDPIVYYRDREIAYKEYLKAFGNKPGKLNLNNMDVLFFYGDDAVALYGEAARAGLYIVYDKED